MPSRKEKASTPSANLFVVARFLDRLAEPRGWTRATLQAACGVNYDIFRRYLALLEGKGFVAVSAQGGVRLTAAGAVWREQLRAVLSEFLEQAPGSRSQVHGAGTKPRGTGALGDVA